MYTRKRGSALLSSIIFLSIACVFAIAFFKFTQNDIKMQAMDDFELDVYDMSEKEEDILKRFMDKINSKNKMCEGTEYENIFSENFAMKDKDNELRYVKDEDIFILQYKNEEGFISERKIKYRIKGERINFIPTYTIKK